MGLARGAAAPVVKADGTQGDGVLRVTDIKARINHGLARMDARETVAHVAPIRRKLGPALAVGLGGSLLWYNWRRAWSQESRNKVLLRDVLTIGGTTVGLLAGIQLTRTRLARRLADGLAALIGGGAPGAAKAAPGSLPSWKNLTARSPSLEERLGRLFKPQLGDHGAEGFIKLESMALGAIVGGGLGGVLADALNRENVRQTASAKLKEGIFQFVGNITFCTMAILGMAALGKRTGTLMSKVAPLKKTTQKSLVKTLQALQGKPVGDPALVPPQVTMAVERILLQSAGSASGVVKALNRLLAAEYPQLPASVRRQRLLQVIPALKARDYPRVHRDIRALVSEAVRQDMRTLTQDVVGRQGRAPVSPMLERLATRQAENRSQLFGILVGLGAGVLGGAWTSNQVNAYMAKKLNLPSTGRHKVGFFSPPAPGMLQGRVGDRGIHWWDALLHIDDWPSALYLAGVHSLGSLVNVMYGISGYLTGTAGTDYSRPPLVPLSNPDSYTRGRPLQRRGFESFRRVPM